MEVQDLPYKCDLIMKGGITSGVVYPPAIAELAKDHRFYSIGGASAGALAAAATAAAEFGRQSGSHPAAFDVMDGINREISGTTGKTTVLQNLIQPQDSTRRYFDLLWALKKASSDSSAPHDRPSPLTRARRATTAMRLFLWGLITHGVPKTVSALLGVSLLIIAALGAVFVPNSLATGIVVGIVACMGLFLWAVGSLVNLYGSFQATFVDNHFGLCNGTTPNNVGITDWLHAKIQLLAFGSTPPDRPLTYGDLHTCGIELVTMTTNASQGESLAFPFADEDAWAFDPADALALLPRDVAEYMIECGEKTRDGWKDRLNRDELPPSAAHSPGETSGIDPKALLPLPPAWDLPVLLGARFSYPIPPILSAFPLYRRIRDRRAGGASAESEDHYCKVWLTDGGICSNLPVHLFDAALPSRPTYAINLSTTGFEVNRGEDEMTDAHRRVHRPLDGGVELDLQVHEITSVSGFMKRLLDSARNWSDNSTQGEIGVRDRICTIELGPHEGGLNLDMTSETIRGLEPRGRAAGENLAWMVTGRQPALDPRRGSDADTQWLQHRWIRMLATIEGSAKFIEKLAERGMDEDIVPQGRLNHELERSLCYNELRNPDSELRKALGVDDSMWNDQVEQTLDEIITKLVEVPFGSAASLDVSHSERKLALSTRRPTTTITCPWDDMDRDGVVDSIDTDADGDGSPIDEDVDDRDPKVQHPPSEDGKTP